MPGSLKRHTSPKWRRLFNHWGSLRSSSRRVRQHGRLRSRWRASRNGSL